MDEGRVVDTWMLFRTVIDKKQVEIVAEKYVDLCADYGVGEDSLINSMGSDSVLDDAIKYYLDIEENNDDEDSEDEDY